jgi:hypothetical protein
MLFAVPALSISTPRATAFALGITLCSASCAVAPRSPGQVDRDASSDEGSSDDDGEFSGDGDSSSGDGDFWEGSGDGDSSGSGGTDFGSLLCGLIGGCDGGVMPPAPYDGGTSSEGDDSIVPGREPDPNNPKECPKHAPDNPIGSCIGLPIYVTCSYTTYHCICDWYHWLCI